MENIWKHMESSVPQPALSYDSRTAAATFETQRVRLIVCVF